MPALLAGKGDKDDDVQMANQKREEKQEGGRRKLRRNTTDQGEADKEEKKVAAIKGGHRKLMKVMVKQLLKLAQSQRDLEGATFDTVVTKSSAAEVVSMQTQTKAYGDGVKEQGKNHNLGPPHIYAWMGLVEALVKRGVALGQLNFDTLKEHQAKMKDMSIEETCDLVRFCRCHRMFNQEQRRITLAISDASLRTVVLAALVQTGAERKLGRGPAGNMERELQMYIEGMEEADR